MKNLNKHTKLFTTNRIKFIIPDIQSVPTPKLKKKFEIKRKIMGTPLKPLRFLLSPKVNSPRVSPTNKWNQKNTPKSVKNGCIAKKLEFASCNRISKSVQHNIKINVINCENINKIKKSLLVNTPNKMEVLKNGLKSYGDLNILGRGGFGVVVGGKYKGQDVAVKVIKTKPMSREYNALKLDHKNIVKTIDIIMKNEENTIIILEHLGKSQELQGLLNDESYNLNFETLLKYALDIANGVSYCHQNNIMHLDMKPSNVILCDDCICKICDFGSSCILGEETNDFKHEGTVAYTSPEILLGETPSFASDVYSLGIIFWQMRYREIPYNSLKHKHVIIYKVVKYGLRPKCENREEQEDDFSNLFKSCWSNNAVNRPNVLSVINVLENLL